MTYALAAISETTYGGVYYCANFTTTGDQPVWTKLTTTGLPNLTPSIFRLDYGNPLNVQYLQFVGTGTGGSNEIYMRNAGNWSKIFDADAATAALGTTVGEINWLWTDPTVYGSVYCLGSVYVGALNIANYIFKSLDYGATWTATAGFSLQSTSLIAEVIGNYIWANGEKSLLANCVIAGSSDGGATWGAVSMNCGGKARPTIRINPQSPNKCIAYTAAFAVEASISGTTIGQAALGHNFSASGSPDDIWYDQNDTGYAVYLDSSLGYTEDDWNTVASTTLTGASSYNTAITQFWNEQTDDLVFGRAGGESAIYHLSSKLDTTPADRSGANSTSAPYADSIPNIGSVVEYGIWAGTPPASKGVYVYSVEMEASDAGWSADVTDYAKIGTPMGGDRSSFRDMPVDGFDVYHAEDVHAATPQIHAPWDEASPPGDGYGIISDGTKWEVSSAPIATTGDLHDAVTLDADAAVVLDLNGQEIGLDVQTANTVFAGPASGAANEPTFRALALADLPAIALDNLSDVDVTGADAYDILRYNGATWEDGRHNIRKTTTITADTTLDDTYDVVIVDASGGDVTVTLPDAVVNDGLEFAIKRIDDSANSVTIQPAVNYLVDDSGDYLIDDDGTYLVDDESTHLEGASVGLNIDQYTAIQIVADADADSWWII